MNPAWEERPVPEPRVTVGASSGRVPGGHALCGCLSEG